MRTILKEKFEELNIEQVVQGRDEIYTVGLIMETMDWTADKRWWLRIRTFRQVDPMTPGS